MFAMLSGPWPRVLTDGTDVTALEVDVAAGRRAVADVEAAVDALVRETIEAQAEAGMGFVTDGHVRWADPAAVVLAALDAGDSGPDGLLLRAWRASGVTAAAVSEAAAVAQAAAVADAAAAADVPVAQALPGPYTLGRRGCADIAPNSDERRERTLSLAGALAGDLAALAAAGCPVVVVEEPAAVGVGADPWERALFAAAQQRLLADTEAFPDLHAMLAVTGGSAWEAGAEAIFAAPYRSYLFDLIAGPDNWYLVRAAPPERGIVCGAMSVEATGGEDQLPTLVWAARYAASAGGRGLERIGLANGTPLGGLDPARAREALLTLGRAADLAVRPLQEAVKAGLDPRTVGSRTAALGPDAPPPPRSRRRRAVP